jgi:hypothetical protein
VGSNPTARRTEPAPPGARLTGMRTRLRVTLIITAAAVLTLAVANAAARADEPNRGWILDQGAPMYFDDPNSASCFLGCTQPDTTPVKGTPVTILCRTEFGYLKVLFDNQPGKSWVFAADVEAFGKPRACGSLD